MRRRAFPGHGPDTEAKYARAAQWIRAAILGDQKSMTWCGENDVPIVKAAGEGIGSTGGFLVPQDLSAAILDLREAYGAFRRTARIVPMASDNTRVPRRPGGTGAYFTAESAAATQSLANVDAVSLTTKKISSLILLSSEIEEDAAPSGIVDYVANEIAWAFGSKEDDCAFNGDGTSAYGGMRGLSQIVLDGNHGIAKVTAASAHNTYGTIDGVDIGALTGAVRASAIPNASWFMSQTCFANTICRLAASGGYLEMRVVDGVNTTFYLGFPIVLSPKLPLVTTTLSGKVMMAFGDMYAAGVLGQRRGITLARSSDRYFDSDQIAILGTERFDAVIHDAGDNTNAGSIAALVAP